MPLTPAASPSSPSSQLMALVMPTSQITVASALKGPGRSSSRSVPSSGKGRSMLPMRTPCCQTAIATATCPASRGSGGRANRSSARPITKKQRAPANVVQISWSLSGGSWANPPNDQVRARARLKPATMPIPPRRTIGRLCCLRASGGSTNPQRRPKRRTSGTIRAVSNAALTHVSRAAAFGL